MATIQQTFAFLQPEDTTGIAAPMGKFAGGAKPLLNRNQSQEPDVLEPNLPVDDRSAVLRRLRAQVGCVSTAAIDTAAKLSTGCQAIDAMLPNRGLKANAITEWVAESDSSGAAALSLITTATYLRSLSAVGPLLVVDIDKTFYPPAAVALGIPMQQIILVRPRRQADLVWAIDQALRCDAVAAVWAHVAARLDDRDARRFQLAAETGNTPGFLVRPQAVRRRPSFADVRFHVDNQPNAPGHSSSTPSPNRERGADCGLADASGYEKIQRSVTSPNRLLQVTLDRCRGGVIGQSVWVHINDQAQIHHVSLTQSIHHETAAVHLASQLANPTTAQSTGRRQRRA